MSDILGYARISTHTQDLDPGMALNPHVPKASAWDGRLWIRKNSMQLSN